MKSPVALNEALREYCAGLHAGSRNYTVRAEVIVVAESNATSPIDALVQAFDANTKVYGYEAEDFEQMWATVKSCLT